MKDLWCVVRLRCYFLGKVIFICSFRTKNSTCMFSVSFERWHSRTGSESVLLALSYPSLNTQVSPDFVFVIKRLQTDRSWELLAGKHNETTAWSLALFQFKFDTNTTKNTYFTLVYLRIGAGSKCGHLEDPDNHSCTPLNCFLRTLWIITVPSAWQPDSESPRRLQSDIKNGTVYL